MPYAPPLGPRDTTRAGSSGDGSRPEHIHEQGVDASSGARSLPPPPTRPTSYPPVYGEFAPYPPHPITPYPSPYGPPPGPPFWSDPRASHGVPAYPFPPNGEPSRDTHARPAMEPPGAPWPQIQFTFVLPHAPSMPSAPFLSRWLPPVEQSNYSTLFGAINAHPGLEPSASHHSYQPATQIPSGLATIDASDVYPTATLPEEGAAGRQTSPRVPDHSPLVGDPSSSSRPRRSVRQLPHRQSNLGAVKHSLPDTKLPASTQRREEEASEAGRETGSDPDAEGSDDPDVVGDNTEDEWSSEQASPTLGKRLRSNEESDSRKKPKPSKSVKQHTCSKCGKSFPRPSGLRTHNNIHTGDKPWSCLVPGCSKQFTVKSNMTRHLRTHNDGLKDGTDPSMPPNSGAHMKTTFETPVVAEGGPEWTSRPLRWVPDSLSQVANIDGLRARADLQERRTASPRTSPEHSISARHSLSSSPGSSSLPFSPGLGGVEEEEDDEVMRSMPHLPVPLPPVTPSAQALAVPGSSTSPGPDISRLHIEERDSYGPAASYPYHPQNFRGLPGPAPTTRRTPTE